MDNIKITVQQMVDEMPYLSVVSGGQFLDREIYVMDVSRPALELTGYFDYYPQNRIQLFGATEISFINRMTVEEKTIIIKKLCQPEVPAFLVSRGLDIPEEMIQYATENSLILFDEIGRGTATYDGMALAQAIIEYIANKIKAQTFFATHYHELTNLSNSYSNITNLHVKAIEENNKMTFLHQVEEGASDRSYGIQVAALANLPKELIERSKVILNALEENKREIEIDLFNYQEEVTITTNIKPIYEEVINELESLDINQLTPIEALVYLKNIQNKVKK